MGYIYKITNRTNNKIYVGMTRLPIEKRWKKHLSSYMNSNMKLHEAMRKDGVENFVIEMLEVVDDELLPERERYWIKVLNSQYPNGYNITPGGYKLFGKENPFYGKRHTQETKYKISQIASQRKGNLNPFYGHKHTEEAKRRISNANKGKVHSEDYKEYMKKINTGKLNPFYGRKHSETTKQYLSLIRQTKNIVMQDENKNIIKYFSCMKKVVDYIRKQNFSRAKTQNKSIASAISKAIRHHTKAYGYYWDTQQESVTTIETTTSNGRKGVE
ncbi:NUMOD3 domain-containing DNA-binding protein [Paraclostridium dentum]|uniref:NUMOD3 domain-containing DNA-binding protein n=1 Tax=Paraclostridium dentum TaxID=2662455 RepID=UPI00346470D2